MRKLIVFDFDGTLIDTWPHYADAFHRYCAEKNLPKIDYRRVLDNYAQYDVDFGLGGSVGEQATHVWQAFKVAEAEHADPDIEQPDLFDGAKDVCAALKEEGHVLAVCTSKPGECLENQLNYHKIGHLFKGHVSSSDMALKNLRRKPHPDKLLHIIGELGFNIENSMVVGDTDADMRMGKAAGCLAVGVNWGVHGPAVLKEAGADHILRGSLRDLFSIMKS